MTTTTTTLDPAAWMAYCLRWAARMRRRHGDMVDWEQAAIDGLDRAARTHSGVGPAGHWVRVCLESAARDASKHARRARRDWRRTEQFNPQDWAVEPTSRPEPDAIEPAEACGAILGRFPPRDRLDLLAVALDGLCWPDVGRANRESVATPYRRVRRRADAAR